MVFVFHPYHTTDFVLDVIWNFWAYLIADLVTPRCIFIVVLFCCLLESSGRNLTILSSALFWLSSKPIPDQKKVYVFPEIHSCLQKSVTTQLNNYIQKWCGLEAEKAKNFTTHSLRKGPSTIMMVSSDVTPEERIFRTGHTFHKNADTYVEDSPASSKPPGMKLAGWKNIRKEVFPASLEHLHPDSRAAADRLVTAVITNLDVPELKPGGILHGLALDAIASVIMYFPQLILMVGYDNYLVRRCRELAVTAKVNDPDVAEGEYDAVMTRWSQRITDRFKEANPNTPGDAAPIQEQVCVFFFLVLVSHLAKVLKYS